jgi:serine/threonine protein kinase
MSTDPSDSHPTDHTTGAWRIGTWLGGKYRLDAVLGAGGMAVVYAATHRNKKRVAVKMLLEPISSRLDVRARFLREGYVANSVEHSGAVSVLDDDVCEDGTAYLVMELLQGQTVEEACRRAGRRLSVAATLSIAYQVLDTLAAAHAKNIVHRDIKPANLFMTHEGNLKILDFGIARLRETETPDGQTQAGASLGTPAFMAPEQAMGTISEVDAQSDVWSVGATMFRLLSGRKVHIGETTQHLVMLAATTPAVPLASVIPEVDPRVAAIVDKALAFDKKDRWPSAAAMKEAVGAVYRSLYGDPGPAPLRTSGDSQLGTRTEVHLQPPPALASSPSIADAQPAGASPVTDAERSSNSSNSTAGPVSSSAVPKRGQTQRSTILVAALGGAVTAIAAFIAVLVLMQRPASPVTPIKPPLADPSPTEPPLPATTVEPKPPPTAETDPTDAGEAPSAATTRGTTSTPPPPAHSRKSALAPSSRSPGATPPPASDFDRQ